MLKLWAFFVVVGAGTIWGWFCVQGVSIVGNHIFRTALKYNDIYPVFRGWFGVKQPAKDTTSTDLGQHEQRDIFHDYSNIINQLILPNVNCFRKCCI